MNECIGECPGKTRLRPLEEADGEECLGASAGAFDLVEHVALLSSGAPILLLCLARPELGEKRPSWPLTLRLEPLDDGDVADLIPDRLNPVLREQIVRAAGGNPLFIGAMLANWLLHGIELPIDRAVHQPLLVSLIGMIAWAPVMMFWLHPDGAAV